MRRNAGQFRAIENLGIVAAKADVDDFLGADNSFLWADKECRRWSGCFEGEVGGPGSPAKVIDKLDWGVGDDGNLGSGLISLSLPTEIACHCFDFRLANTSNRGNTNLPIPEASSSRNLRRTSTVSVVGSASDRWMVLESPSSSQTREMRGSFSSGSRWRCGIDEKLDLADFSGHGADAKEHFGRY